MSTHAIGTNPKDPILKTGPDAGRELTKAMAQVARGFHNEDVVNAAANLIVNVLRQSWANRAQAEQGFNMLFGKTKQLLMDQYDANGKRRSIFAHDQIVSIPTMDFTKKS